MSSPIKNPCFIAGATRSSGDVQTGEIQHVRGGGRKACILSGALAATVLGLNGPAPFCPGSGHTLLYSGAGRLNSYLAHQGQPALSGVTVAFYDAAVPAVGATFSGCAILGILNAPQGLSGQLNSVGIPIPVDMPFNSGLCVAALSGATGFTCSFTVEVSPSFPNA